MAYTLSQFKEIETNGFDLTLSPAVVEAIRTLASIVGAVSYSPTPVFPKPVGKQGQFGEVVGLLNKLTADSYDKISVNVIAVIDHFDPAETEKLCEAIFGIASGNRFYSKLYANLCKELCRYPAFKEIMNKRCGALDLSTLTSEGRALTLFLGNLAINGAIPQEVAVHAAQELQRLVEENLDSAEKKPQIEEWTEHLALLLTISKQFKAACGLDDRLLKISKLPHKAHPGLSVKTIFRYLDILEHFN
jgi:hypothetical protein